MSSSNSLSCIDAETPCGISFVCCSPRFCWSESQKVKQSRLISNVDQKVKQSEFGHQNDCSPFKEIKNALILESHLKQIVSESVAPSNWSFVQWLFMISHLFVQIALFHCVSLHQVQVSKGFSHCFPIKFPLSVICELLTYYLWIVNCDLWYENCDLWSVNCDLWSVICNLWSVIWELCPVNCEL